MTKEETAYAAALNALGSGVVLDSADDLDLRLTLEDLRFEALASTMPPGPKVRCPRCPTPFAYGGPLDGEHFADMWEHLIVRHRTDPRAADSYAQTAWRRPAFDGAVAA